MTVNWHHGNIYSTSVMASEQDIDGLAHTNNSVYVNWCEQAAWQHSASLGLSLAHYREQDRAMAIVKAQYEYLAATYQGQDLLLSTCLLNCDMKMRLQRDFQIVRRCDQQLVFRGSWQFMCIEISSGKPRRMPPLFKDIYGGACQQL
jgi:acyl-CoA thioester hydrolase